MRMSQEEKQNSRRRIVSSAARMIRERGIDGASVADVMNDAGLTHGGFYRHFETKDALLAAALDASFGDMTTLFDELGGPVAVDAFVRYYLSDEHVDHASLGCPVAALASEVTRQSDSLKQTFGAGVRRMIGRLAAGTEGSKPAAARAAAARRLAMMVGSVVIARASDPVTAQVILDACRQASHRQA